MLELGIWTKADRHAIGEDIFNRMMAKCLFDSLWWSGLWWWLWWLGHWVDAFVLVRQQSENGSTDHNFHVTVVILWLLQSHDVLYIKTQSLISPWAPTTTTCVLHCRESESLRSLPHKPSRTGTREKQTFSIKDKYDYCADAEKSRTGSNIMHPVT